MTAYATVADARAEGVPGTATTGIVDTTVQEQLDRWSEFIDRACRQWFEPRTLTIDFDGSDSRDLLLPIPVISVSQLFINGDFVNAIDPDHYRVYSNTDGVRDDRRNPRISIATFGLGIFDMPRPFWSKFLYGTQNQRIVGTFGFVESDGSTPAMIKRAVLRLTVKHLLMSGSGGLWAEMQQRVDAGRVLSETTDGHNIMFNAMFKPIPLGLSGITMDPEVDATIILYKGPILISSTPGAGGPDRRW